MAVDSTLDKQRRAARAATYKALTQRPADEIRAVAVEQIAAFDKALSGTKDRLGSVLGRWRFFDEALAEARKFLAEGDALKASDKEPDRIRRRQLYGRAYINLVAAADQLDPEVRQGATWVVLVEEAAEKAEKAADKAADKAAELADKIGDGLSDLEWAAGVALVGAALAFGFAKGRK